MRPKCARPNCKRHAGTWQDLCNSHYEASLNSRAANGGRPRGLIPAEPVARHVINLRQSGLGIVRIAELSGVSKLSVFRISRGDVKRVTVATAQSLLSIKAPSAPWRIAAGGAQVSSLGAVRKLQALQVIGYKQDYLAERLGTSQSALWHLLNSDQVTASVARRVDAIFRELQMTPGTCERSSRIAKAKGWYPPMAWDEHSIDDPEARPNIGMRNELDWYEEYKDLIGLGLSHNEAAERMNLNHDTLFQRIKRLKNAAKVA